MGRGHPSIVEGVEECTKVSARQFVGQVHKALDCAISLAAIDAAMLYLVIRPVRKLSEMADRISTGDMSLPELPVHGRDEIAGLTASFNRMFVSLQKAFRLLNG